MRFRMSRRKLGSLVGVALLAGACGQLLTEHKDGDREKRTRGSVIQIAAGESHYCALLEGGRVRCWGDGRYGKLGYANTDDVGGSFDSTVALAGDVDVGGVVTQISASQLHTCALLSTGKVRCWGHGKSGKLGYGNEDAVGDNEAPSAIGDVDIGADATAISAGYRHTCAVLETGNVRCWGEHYGDALGYDALNLELGLPPAQGRDAEIGGRVTQVSVGSGHSCALLSTGSVRCWGSFGARLGYGNTYSGRSAEEAGDVALGERAVQVVASSGISCALLEDGDVRCWGSGTYGRLGYGNENDIGDDELPTQNVALGAKATHLSVSQLKTCAVLVGGDVKCWGLGILGYGNTDTIGDDETPADVLPIRLGGKAVEVATTGNAGTCALLTTGHVRCWGVQYQPYEGESVIYGDDDHPSEAGNLCIEGHENSCPPAEMEVDAGLFPLP